MALKNLKKKTKPLVYLGDLSLSNDSYKSLNITGNLVGEQISVGKLKVMGKAVISDSTLGKTNILGKAKFVNVNMTEDFTITGKAVLKDGECQHIVLRGQQFDLNGLKALSITIRGDDPGSKDNKTHQIVLTNCTINGNVVCDGIQDCTLILDVNTKITGKIIGFSKIDQK